MTLKNVDTKRLVEFVCERATNFFETELDISIQSLNFNFSNVTRLELDHLTSIMAVDGPVAVMFAMTFDKPLAQRLFETYTAELTIPDDQKELYMEETVSDIINIVLGNSLSRFEIKKAPISLSPPVVITEAKRISRHRNALFYTADLRTSHGRLQVFCVGPKELFDIQLNYIKEKV